MVSGNAKVVSHKSAGSFRYSLRGICARCLEEKGRVLLAGIDNLSPSGDLFLESPVARDSSDFRYSRLLDPTGCSLDLHGSCNFSCRSAQETKAIDW